MNKYDITFKMIDGSEIEITGVLAINIDDVLLDNPIDGPVPYYEFDHQVNSDRIQIMAQNVLYITINEAGEYHF